MNLLKFKAVGAGEVNLQVKASHIYFRSAELSDGATDDTIIVQCHPGGEYLILQPGQGCPVDFDVTDWRISNASGSGTIKGELVFGKSGFTDNRLTGVVSVIDGGKARTRDGIAFLGYAGQAPVPGQFSHTQLWNPVGSGKNLVVEQIAFGSGSAAGMGMRVTNAPLTTLRAAGTSKMLGGAAAVGECRFQSNAAIIAGVTGADMYSQDLMAGQSVIFTFREPIVVPPGIGLMLYTSPVNTSLSSNFEWYEEGA